MRHFCASGDTLADPPYQAGAAVETRFVRRKLPTGSLHSTQTGISLASPAIATLLTAWGSKFPVVACFQPIHSYKKTQNKTARSRDCAQKQCACAETQFLTLTQFFFGSQLVLAREMPQGRLRSQQHSRYQGNQHAHTRTRVCLQRVDSAVLRYTPLRGNVDTHDYISPLAQDIRARRKTVTKVASLSLTSLAMERFSSLSGARHRMARPGPGKGCRHTLNSSIPRAMPSARTSSWFVAGRAGGNGEAQPVSVFLL